jgi:hypothetical protein
MQQPLTEQFIQERTYFKNVTAKTIDWYRQSFHAFDGAMDSLRWSHTEGNSAGLIRIMKLKEDDKVLATLTPEHVQCLTAFTHAESISNASTSSVAYCWTRASDRRSPIAPARERGL